MTKTVEDVRTRAIRDLGADFSQYNFADDTSFQTYVLELATEVVEDQTPRVNPYSLDTAPLFAAAAFETESRMVQRILNQFYSNVLSTESITIGPITLQQGRNESTSKDIRDYMEMLHNEAEAQMVKGGARSRRGAIRVWTPACRIRII
jgi:hypothetical protein